MPPSSNRLPDDPPEVQYEEDFFIYTALFPLLAAAATLQVNIQIQADSHFKWIKATAQADIAAAVYTESARPIPLAALQLVDSGSGRQLFSSAVPIESLFGSGALPFILPVPRIFRARSNIALTMNNFSVATTYNIRLALIGTKMFAKGGRAL